MAKTSQAPPPKGSQTTQLAAWRTRLADPKTLEQFRAALRTTGTDPSAVARIALTNIARSEDLLECAMTPKGIQTTLSSIVTALQLGLEPDHSSGLAYLVPFRDHGDMTCQLIVGYKGFVQLAFRSSLIASIDVVRVHEKDHFDMDRGRKQPIVHKPWRGRDRGQMICAYSLVHTVYGDRASVYHMWDWEINEVRDRYAKTRKIWDAQPDAMQLKTVFRRHAKWLPSSPTLQRAVSLDEQFESGVPQDLEPLDLEATVIESTAAPTTLGDEVRKRQVDDLRAAEAARTGNPPPTPPPAPANETTTKGAKPPEKNK